VEFTVSDDPAQSPRVSRFVVGRFFTPRELRQAVGRAIFTRDFVLTAGLPLLLSAVASWLPDDRTLPGPLSPKQAAFAGVLLWLVVAAGLLLSMGKTRAIGCVGPDGRLVGGLRLKVSRSKRRICLAGVVVDPEYRGKGIFTALLLAAFRQAERDRERGPLTLTVFGPAHPASRHVVEKYFRGSLVLPVAITPGAVFIESLRSLDIEVRELAEKGVCYRFVLGPEGILGPSKNSGPGGPSGNVG